MRRPVVFRVLALLAVLVLATSCTDDNGGEDDQTLPEFCSQLVSSADPFATEVGDLESVMAELRELLVVSPAEVSPAVETLLGAFETVATQEDPDDATDVLAAQQTELAAAQAELADYAIANCGIDLNR